MAIAINEIFTELNLNYSKPIKWKEKFNANINGVYVIALTNDPFSTKTNILDIKINKQVFDEWLKNSPKLHFNTPEKVNLKNFERYLSQFWHPKENILYIGQSSSPTNPIHKRVHQFYTHKLGNKGPHTGGYWLKLLDYLANDVYVYYAESKNPRDTEFKMLLKFIEKSSQKSIYELDNIGIHLPFANLTADFYKNHKIKNAIKR